MSESKKEVITVKIINHTGSFAENKDIARKLRLEHILPALDKGIDVILDFSNVNSSTQSFIHALISDLIRKKGIGVLDGIFFQNCNEAVKRIVGIVVEYMQHTEEPLDQLS